MSDSSDPSDLEYWTIRASASGYDETCYDDDRRDFLAWLAAEKAKWQAGTLRDAAAWLDSFEGPGGRTSSACCASAPTASHERRAQTMTADDTVRDGLVDLARREAVPTAMRDHQPRWAQGECTCGAPLGDTIDWTNHLANAVAAATIDVAAMPVIRGVRAISTGRAILAPTMSNPDERIEPR